MSMSCTKTKTAIVLPCPQCGNEEAGIELRLWCLDESDSEFRCNECEAEFSAESVRTLIKKWVKVLAWLDAAPDVDGE